MNDIIGNVAQELADHLDDLRDSGEGVTDHDEGDRSFPVTEVGDAESWPNNGVVGFMAVVGGVKVWVAVSVADR